MSGDQTTNDPKPADDVLAQAMRDAEQAVERVRAGRDGEAEESDIDITDDPDAADLVAALAADLAAAKADIEAMRDKWMRSLADLENFKKRTRREIDEAVHRALGNMLSDFLPVGDNLERALAAMPANTEPQLAKGLEMVRGEFFSALGRHGIKPINSVGMVFDPNLHDALQQVDTPDFAPGVVVMEYEKGYLRGERLLRAARVIVAGPGSTGTPPDSNPGEAN
ncbi:nucleotide exchange factor GrpE [Nannocystaceae bacterium ST9]